MLLRQNIFIIIVSDITIGGIWLFFGCRTKALDLYKEEKEEMVANKVLEKTFLALSRDPNIPKVIFITNVSFFLFHLVSSDNITFIFKKVFYSQLNI